MGSKDGRSRASSNRWSSFMSLFFLIARNVEPSSWAFFVLCTSTYLSVYSPVYEYIYLSIYMYMCARVYIDYVSPSPNKNYVSISSHLSFYPSMHFSIYLGLESQGSKGQTFFFVCFVKASVGLKPSPHVCVCVCVYVHTHVCMYVHTHTHTRMYVCMHVCMYVCMYIGLRPRGRDREVYW